MPLGGNDAQAGLVPPADQIPGGRAARTVVTVGKGGTFPPTGLGPPATRVTVVPYVSSTLAAVTANGLHDGAGRALYGAGTFSKVDAVSRVAQGIDIAISTLFRLQQNPYTYSYKIADGGGKFEVCYYSAYSHRGFPDPNGSLNESSVLASPTYVWPVPTNRQIFLYPSLLTSTNGAINTLALAGSLFTANPLRQVLDLTSLFGGAAIGAIYVPGGMDPPLQYLHWFQIIASSNKAYVESTGNISGTGDNLINQDGAALSSISSPDGGTYNWATDQGGVGGDPSPYADLSYDLAYTNGRRGVPLCNTSFYTDTSRIVPYGGVFGLTNRAPDTVTSFYVFKMFYQDGAGNPVANPTPSGGIIAMTILRQGFFYAWGWSSGATDVSLPPPGG